MSFCINCGIATDRCNTIGSRSLEDETILSIVRGWVAPKTVHKRDIICQSCYKNASSVAVDGNKTGETSLGHRRVCTLCGRSLLRRIRSHQLSFGSVQEQVIKEWILPRTMTASNFLCHSCWVRATKEARKFHSCPSSAASSVHESDSVEEDEILLRREPELARRQTSHVNSIVLPGYFRPVETESRCFVKGCCRDERNRVTLSMRKWLLKTYKYYVPPNNRVCDYHSTCTSWNFLNDMTDKINSFTGNQIEDMLALKDPYSFY